MARGSDYERFQELMEEMREEESMSVSGLSVAVREITLMAESANGDYCYLPESSPK